MLGYRLADETCDTLRQIDEKHPLRPLAFVHRQGQGQASGKIGSNAVALKQALCPAIAATDRLVGLEKPDAFAGQIHCRAQWIEVKGQDQRIEF